MRPVDDQSDFLATDARGRAMSDTETMPVELLRDAPDIYGIEPHDLEALAWACGVGPEEASILAAPTAEPGARLAKDRAAVVSRKIEQMVRDALIDWVHGERADMAGVHDAIESLLRDEFNDVRSPPQHFVRRRMSAGLLAANNLQPRNAMAKEMKCSQQIRRPGFEGKPVTVRSRVPTLVLTT
jgi:hypothetical protein